MTTLESSVHTTVPVLTQNTVGFLGLELSPHDAEVALIFVFLLSSALGVIFVGYRLLKTRKKLKRAAAESVNMERM